MKTKFLLFALMLGTYLSIAQVTFKPGFRTGINNTKFSQTDNPQERFTYKTDVYAGIYGALKLSKTYTLQPTITYSRQGSKKETIINGSVTDNTINISYVSVALINKISAKKFSFLVGPTIDFYIKESKKIIESNQHFSTQNNPYNDIDLAFSAGFGYELFSGLGLEAKIKKGIISVEKYSYANYYDNSSNSYVNYDNDYTNIVFQIGLTYTLNTKK